MSRSSRVNHRTLDLASLIARKPLLLLGPRQTGRITLIRDALPGVRSYDLLDSRVFFELSRSPKRLAEELDVTTRIVGDTGIWCRF